jgi:hypothetical protein
VDGIFAELLSAANKNPPENDRERTGLLIRATQTEEVSWTLDEYRAGRTGADIDPNVPLENSLDEKARLDLHDLRVHAAQYLSNARSELLQFAEALEEHQYSIEDITYLTELCEGMKRVGDSIEPRRLFKRS